ncbi:hypothetical protein GCM10023232_08930 [Sphingosinicella ginsenosidimutans]|uniref:Uncharacterized protein n=1 Tax=Allosphingosinicella ginsenosidimutans TaxID=1176539 RepID=A0A5C6TXU8_9SPHN|nr:hypothetical protein [Sphingosinicella ginsenosidimutans]TXC64701.1 hypothetical protein FRZ32_14210 [Sphingosinicella ginsenosidimutans]
MFRATVHLDERANVADETESLRAGAERSGLDPAVANVLSANFAEVLVSLVENGRKLKAQGSQLDVTRKFEGKSYSVTLKFGAGSRPRFFAQLWRFLRGR